MNTRNALSWLDHNLRLLSRLPFPTYHSPPSSSIPMSTSFQILPSPPPTLLPLRLGWPSTSFPSSLFATTNTLHQSATSSRPKPSLLPSSTTLAQSTAEAQGEQEEGHPHPPHLFSYPEGSARSSVLPFDGFEALSAALSARIQAVAAAAIDSRGVFTLVLSGGSLIKVRGGLCSSSRSDTGLTRGWMRRGRGWFYEVQGAHC